MDVTAKSAMILDVKVFFLKSEKVNAENSSTAPRNGSFSAGNLCCTVSQERFLARKMIIRTMSIIPKLFLGVEYCATFQAALYIETHSLMHQSEFYAASVALTLQHARGRGGFGIAHGSLPQQLLKHMTHIASTGMPNTCAHISSTAGWAATTSTKGALHIQHCKHGKPLLAPIPW